MIAANDESRAEPHPAPPVTRGGSHIDATHLMMGVLLFVIAVSAIVGIVVAATSGQGTIALIIALFAGAFFSRVFC